MLEQQDNKTRKTGATVKEMVRPRKPVDSFADAGRLFSAQVDEVPTMRVPRRPQSSSRHSFSGKHEFRMLPPLSNKELTEAKRKELFVQKLAQCSVVFDFQNFDENIEGKEAKQQTLVEIIDYMSDRVGIVTPDVYPTLFMMVSANLFRTIPPQINAFGDPYDPEEDEPREEPAWPHLYLVYLIFLRFLESGDFNSSAARPYIDQTFTTQLLDLFDCEDVRERESLKTVLHRIYGKMLGMRSFIRRSINNIFLQFTYETQRHNGIAELLEILGSIINGFTVPLKEEHINFLHRVLLPLHKARPMSLYYAQLSYCTIQFLEKDPMLGDSIIKALLRYWPKVNSPKELMFVNEIEGILDSIDPAQFTLICQLLFQQLVKCIVSPHFQVAERTLAMWRNSYIVNLITDNIHLILPIVLSGIYRHSRSHWNRNIHNQVFQVLRFFVNVNEEMFEHCLAEFRNMRDSERQRSAINTNWWTKIEKLAKINGQSMPNAQQLLANIDKVASPKANSQTASSNDCRGELESPAEKQQNHHEATGNAEEAAGGLAMNGTVSTTVSAPNGQDANDGGAKMMSADREQTDNGADGQTAKELPMSRLDNPDDMCCEMDEDEFIRELDKFVDIIRYEDPDTVAANGLLILNENGEPNFSTHADADASDIAYHDIQHQLTADAIGMYGGHEYVSIHSINDTGRLSAHAHEDVVMTSAELHHNTLAMVPPSLSASSNDDGAQLPDAVDARMVISPHSNSIDTNDINVTGATIDGGNGNINGNSIRRDESHEIANGGMSMDTSGTPPPQMST
ncbi:serine/threonine-protein phosphatase 2A 56 kDa regulatory subunit delta isoform [Coemansia sp. RSA 487]|nr:serine/threonine-protein phosphatase 2A 56 kDa regulatory subunit delta isoform [Coemansia sp. RSA 487]